MRIDKCGTLTTIPLVADEVAELNKHNDNAAKKLSALARTLDEIARDIGDPEDVEQSPISAKSGKPNTPYEMAVEVYRNRRRRARIFGNNDLFGEPSWDIMLDLFIAGERKKLVSVTSACIGADVPTTTALRWLTILEKRGLVVRQIDGQDARRVLVSLTDKARDVMIAYFS